MIRCSDLSCVLFYQRKADSLHSSQSSDEALIAPESCADPDLSLFLGAAELLCSGPYKPFPYRCQMVLWWL